MEHTRRRQTLAHWLRRLALLALVALPSSVLIVRAGWWQPGLLVYAAACLLSALLLLTTLAVTLLPGLRTRLLVAPALAALPGSILLAIALVARTEYPAIHDVSTDLDDPPTFSHAPALRGDDANSLQPDPATQAAQRQAYPDIASLQSPQAQEAAYQRALATARALNWEVVYQRPDEGVIEAVARTPVMGFRDDIVIRLRAGPGSKTEVDLRSVSRVGVSDFGANANRIRAFLQQFSLSEETTP